MIKVNLNRSRVPTGADDAAAAAIAAPIEGDTDPKELAIKIILIVIFTLGLWVVEKQNIDQLSAQLSTINGQLNKVRQDVQAKSNELAQLKDIEPQAQALNEKLRILREFSKQRLENLQSLDYLQSVIPERVWLNSIDFQNKRYKMMGNAMDTIDLTEFVNKLEGSAYYQDVIVVSDTERPVAAGKIRDFEMTARAGVKN